MVGVAIDVFVPDIPEDLDLKIKRERFLARQALSHIPEKVSQPLQKLFFSLWS